MTVVAEKTSDDKYIVIQSEWRYKELCKSLPGSSWSFPARHWRQIVGPLEDRTGGEDLAVCQGLLATGYRLAALDLTEHIGERESAWGNRSWERAQPLRVWQGVG